MNSKGDDTLDTHKVQITDKITAFHSNSPTSALADLLPLTEAKVVTARPGQE